MDICGSNCADLGAFLRFRLDLGGCSRFEWIWLSLGGLELVRPDSGAKVINLDGLGPIAQNDTKTSNLEPLNDTLRGFAALQASKRHLPKALGLPGVSKRHLPKGLSLTRGWAVPSLF